VSVQHISDGTIVLWKDYWDLQTLMGAAPAAWHERLDTADLS
jgi:limonene-1,2-epoxide hydrolase